MHKVITDSSIAPFFKIDYNPRTKIFITPKFPKSSSPLWVRKAREASIFFTGPKLYNSLPQTLREIGLSTSKFKQLLDKHLSTIPDLPGNSKNSLIFH